jgi:type IV secretion system protein VirD4
MGFETDPFSSGLINFFVQMFTNIASSFLRLFGRKPKPPEPPEFMAQNPPTNGQLASAEPHGLFFGTRGNKYVIKPEDMDGHVLVCGTPGSGKSSCVAIPTLRSWKGSVFAVDIKGELYANTKAQRKNIKLFSPQDKDNAYSYDPFVFLNQSNNPVQEARAIAQAIIPLSPDSKEPFWVESAQIILTGAILHFHHEKKTFIQTLKTIQMFSPKELIKMVSGSSVEKAVLCVKSFAEIDGKVLAGIATEISRGIVAIVTDDDIVTALTHEENKETITPADLEKGIDIYIKIPEHLLRQWKNLLTLMTNQFISFFERRIESVVNSTAPHSGVASRLSGQVEFSVCDNRPILFLLDEFPRLGKIPAITDALATLRSKKITICLIVQSLAQLDMIYGHDTRKVIADTCAYKAILSASDADTQEYFSKLVGTYEKTLGGGSQGFDPYLGASTGHSKSYSEGNDKRIIKSEEFATLREIILLYPLPHNFCRVRKRPYYEVVSK